MSKEEEEYWKSLDWSWINEWIDGMIEKWKEQGYTEEQIIKELSKYGDVKIIEGED